LIIVYTINFEIVYIIFWQNNNDTANHLDSIFGKLNLKKKIIQWLRKIF